MSIFERRDPTAFKRISVSSSTSSTSCLTSLMRENDVVKRGCLHVKRPPTNSTVKLRIKAWQKRYLVLRDSWTPEGDTTLELHDSDLALPTTVASVIVSSSSMDDVSSVGISRRPVGSRRNYIINLRTVIYVDIYNDSKSFPHAFIVFRTGKSPVIFGAKSDMEMREWMMAIKLLADKLHTRSSVREVTSAINVANNNASSRRIQQRQKQITETTDAAPPVANRRRRSELPPIAAAAVQGDMTATKRDDAMRRSTPQLMTSSPGVNSPKIQKCVNKSSPQNTDKQFRVRLQHYSDVSMTRRLHGEFILAVGDVDISLRNVLTSRSTDDIVGDGDDAIVRWLLQDIRKLKCESCDDGFGDVITLVTMSNSTLEDGAVYQFRIGCGLNVIRCVRQLVRKLDPQAMSARSRDDLTTVVGSVPSTVGRQRAITSDTSMANPIPMRSAGTGGDLPTPISRSQPDLLSHRIDSHNNGENDRSSINNFITYGEYMPPTSKDEHHASGAGAFYLPLIDNKDDNQNQVSEADNFRAVTVSALQTPSPRQISLSKSTGALNSSIIHGVNDLSPGVDGLGSSSCIEPRAPTPPPRPIHTMSSFDDQP